MKYFIVLSVVTYFFFSVTTTTAEIRQISRIGFGGDAYDIFLSGDLIYIAAGQVGLVVSDISDIEHPRGVGSWDNPAEGAKDVIVEGEVAYIANSSIGLFTVDVSDLEDMEQLDYFRDSRADKILIVGDIIYVAAQNDGFLFIDISDPRDLNEINRFDTPGYANDFKLIDETAYIADGVAGLTVVDLSDIEEPQEIGSIDTPGFAYGLFVVDDFCYIADRNGGIRIIDISDPENPEEVSNIEFEDTIDVFVIHNFVFVVSRELSRLAVIDISDPEDPEIVETYDLPGRGTAIKIVETIAYVSNSSGVAILDVSDYIYNGPFIDLSTAELDFEDVGLNLSDELTLTISNIGNEDLTVSDISIEGDRFSTDFEEEFTVEPDEEAEITVSFSPEEPGEVEGMLTISSNDEENGEVEVALSGVGVGAVIDVNPGALDFQAVGIDVSVERTLRISNNGLIDLVISRISNENEAYTTDFEEELTIAPDERRSLTVTFTPQLGILYRDTLIITCNDLENGELSIPLSGRGEGAVVVVDPDAISFGQVGRNRSAEIVAAISNDGQIELVISEFSVEGNYFSSDLDSARIAPDESLDLTITFAPEAVGEFRGILYIISNDRMNEELNIPVNGVGAGPVIAVDSESLEFGLGSVGWRDEMVLTITAEGLTDLTISDVSIEGDHFNTNFEQETFIELDDSYELTVTFNPDVDGFLESALIIHSDDPDNPEKSVALSGSAIRGFIADTPGSASAVFVSANFVYVADSEGGLRVFNVFDPSSPDEIGSYDTPGNASGVTLNGNHAYVADGENGVFILDVSSPQSPDSLSSFETPGNAMDVTVADDFAYIADGGSGIRVVNIYDPARPIEVGHFDTEGVARSVTVVGNYAYVADDSRGLRILDVSDPEQPSEVGSFDTRGWTWEVYVRGDLAYLADERYGLRIVDVSDPSEPVEIGFYDTEANAYGVYVSGDHAYVADGAGGIAVIRIGDPEQPELVDIYYAPAEAGKLIVSEDFAYVADGEAGLLILDVAGYVAVDEATRAGIPSEFKLLAAYPNPFNATTRIPYQIPVRSQVLITIHDLHGQMVESLVDRSLGAGYYQAVWDASDIAAGVYLCRIEAGDFRGTGKLLLVR